MIEFTERSKRKLRNAQAELVEEVGVAKVMALTLKSKSVVYRWKDSESSDLMSLEDVMKVEGYHRRPIVTQEMAYFLGCDLANAPVRDIASSSLSLHTAELVEHVSRLVVETARAKADGMLTIAEATSLLDLVNNAERLIPVIKDALVGVQVNGPLKVVRDAVA